ncbi:MAG TPA: 3-oxoacyl-[acyl-carrier-protein] synthase III C-terminal domain-containing protein [Candidatus Dormibacteraeota bacterium]|nr:3-oxoacyl-[acyl-carrier-protein] synthase III C-terminal domain-containing protein [Candidatus Dormibacteraeota bacterium]
MASPPPASKPSAARPAPSAFLGFGTALPEHRLDAETGIAALRQLWPRLRGARPEPVTRYLIRPLEWLLTPRSLEETMRTYAEQAARLAEVASGRALDAAGVEPEEIDLVVTVSCTGYLLPSLDVRLAADLGLRPDVIRLPLTELGCSGGAAGVAVAHRHLAAYPRDRVLVIAVELPSLTFQRQDRSLDNLTAAMVFGDGAAAAVMGGAGRQGGGELQVLGAGSWLLPRSAWALGFDLRDGGFHVVLDRRLPDLVRTGLGPAVTAFRRRRGLERVDFYAVHAGGPRILDAVAEALQLEPAQLALSRRVFREVGNLSSASILFVLAQASDVAGDGLAIALGPGVTIELLHLRADRGTPGPAG